MYGRCFTEVVVTCGVLMGCCFAVHDASAQLLRGMRGYAAPIPAQPAPDVAPQPPQAPVASPAPALGGEQGAAAQTQAGDNRHVLRGRELIGMSIWGRNRERLGTVKDFIVDIQGSCPTLFFAMAPEIPGWNGDYVIVPFGAFQVGYDERQRMDYFVLGVAMDNLRQAPRLGIDRWNSLPDPRLFADSQQFYRRVERTAARPEDFGRGREGRGRDEQEMRQRSERERQQTPATPGSQAPSATGPDTRREPDANRQPSQPAALPEAVRRGDQPRSGTTPDTLRRSDPGKQPPLSPLAPKSEEGSNKPKSTNDK
jgi:hypothetical protein